MNFNFDDFREQKYVDRTSVVSLKNFGENNETIEWHVRGLNAEDLAFAEEAANQNRLMSSLADMLVSSTDDNKEKVAAIKEIAGISAEEKISPNLIKKYIIFERGSIVPNKPQSRQDVIKFARVYPIEFYKICNEIYALTGMGAEGKKKASDSGNEAK